MNMWCEMKKYENRKFLWKSRFSGQFRPFFNDDPFFRHFFREFRCRKKGYHRCIPSQYSGILKWLLKPLQVVSIDQVVAYASTTILENSFVTLLYSSQKGNREWIHQNGTQEIFIKHLFWSQTFGKSLASRFLYLNQWRIKTWRPGVTNRVGL